MNEKEVSLYFCFVPFSVTIKTDTYPSIIVQYNGLVDVTGRCPLLAISRTAGGPKIDASFLFNLSKSLPSKSKITNAIDDSSELSTLSGTSSTFLQYKTIYEHDIPYN